MTIVKCFLREREIQNDTEIECEELLREWCNDARMQLNYK